MQRSQLEHKCVVLLYRERVGFGNPSVTYINEEYKFQRVTPVQSCHALWVKAAPLYSIRTENCFRGETMLTASWDSWVHGQRYTTSTPLPFLRESATRAQGYAW